MLQIHGLANDEQLRVLPAAIPNAPFSLQRGLLFEDTCYRYGRSTWSMAVLCLTAEERCWVRKSSCASDEEPRQTRSLWPVLQAPHLQQLKVQAPCSPELACITAHLHLLLAFWGWPRCECLTGCSGFSASCEAMPVQRLSVVRES